MTCRRPVQPEGLAAQARLDRAGSLRAARTRLKGASRRHANCQSDFARALRNPDLAVPAGVIAHIRMRRKSALRSIATMSWWASLVHWKRAFRDAQNRGEDFFKGAEIVRRHAAALALMLFYGDAFPAFLADFEPRGSTLSRRRRKA
jgi:hypothetical protein